MGKTTSFFDIMRGAMVVKQYLQEKLKSHEIQYFILLVVIGIFMMSFCSYTSPAFYFDYSPDNNAFFSVGKAMMHGIVPYRDIFEQKGPYVYLLHGIAYLIAHRSFIVIFFVGITALVSAMILTYKISRVLKLGELPAFLMAILSPMLFLFHPYYDYGDTVEFFVLPFLLSLIYIILLIGQGNNQISNKSLFMQGLIVGIIFLSKYTLLGAWIVFYIMLGIYFLVNKKWQQLKKMVIWSGAGFLVAVIPWLIYFLITNSLGAFINVYFLFNTKVYLTSSVSFFSNIIQSAILLAQFYLKDVLFFILGLLGTLIIIFQATIFKTKFSRGLYLAAFLGNNLLALYGYQAGDVYQYYQLVYFAFFVIPFIYYGKLFFAWVHLPDNDDPFVILATLIVSFFLVLGVNNNVTSSRLFPNNASITKKNTTKSQVPAQTEFGRIMRHRTTDKRNLTLLNYGSIDMGFYTSSGAIPNTFYFQNYNIPEKAAPQILRAQRNVITHKRVKWVVLNTPAKRTLKSWRGDSYHVGQISGGNLNPGTAQIAMPLSKGYKLVKTHVQSFESVNVKYWLFERK